MFGHNPKKQSRRQESFFLGDIEAKEKAPASSEKEEAKPKIEKKPQKKHLRAKRDIDKPKSVPKKAEKKALFPAKKHLRALRDLKKSGSAPLQEKEPVSVAVSAEQEAKEKEAAVRNSLDGMFGVYKNKNQRPKKSLSRGDIVRYAVLFVCIFGFFLTGYFVFRKLFDYYRSYLVYSGLQEMVEEADRFADDYMKKAASSVVSITPEEAFDGKSNQQNGGAFSNEQETLVRKISQLKKINPDTVGWININGTVVNYPVVRSDRKDYYLRRNFYGKVLSGGSIYVDNRNSPNLLENRNTVIYGHNMADGSMFASIHDFASASVFYNAKIEITTEEGVFIYTPFSAHESHEYDNYFETDFVSDEDFISFCQQVSFLSIYETTFLPNKDTQIITLSTCSNDENAREQRFAVHAYLTEVIR